MDNCSEACADRHGYYRAVVRDFGGGCFEVLSHRYWWRTSRDSTVREGRARIPEEPQEVTPEQQAAIDAANQARSARRARQNLRWRILSIAADRLWTLTYRENVTDLARVKRDWDKFRRLMLERWPEWQYVAVPEQQERGAWHIHYASRGYQHVQVVRAIWHRVVGKDGGNVDVAYRARNDDGGSASGRGRIARYLGKYVAKTFGDDVPIWRRYWSTRCIVVPKLAVLLQADTLDAMMREAYSLARPLGAPRSSWLSSDWTCFLLSSG